MDEGDTMAVNVKQRVATIGVLAVILACAVGMFGMQGHAYAAENAGLNAAETAVTDDPIAEEPVHADGWEFANNAWHYWEGNVMQTSRWIETASGPQISGLPAGVHRYWIDQNGNLAMNRLINTASEADKLAGYCAYATNYGYVATGKTVVGNKIYLAKANGKLESGNKKAGLLVTANYDKGKKKRWYYIDKKTHAVITGKEVKIAGYGKVYNDPKTGHVVRGVTKFDKKHVLLADSRGRLCQKHGWVKTKKYAGSTQWYRLERTTKNKKVYGARTGYFKVRGKKYLGIRNTGYLFRNGYKKINGKYWHANDRGKLTKDAVVNRLLSKAQGYGSPSRYLLMVDVDNPRVVVFEGYRWHWKVKYIWDCCTGTPNHATVTGVFSIGAKGYSFGEGHGYSCYYYSQITGDYLFHTRKYYPNTSTLMDPRIGKRVSMGCVRLYDEDALWIQRNCPSGTTVVCTY